MYRKKVYNRNTKTPSTENVLKRALKTIDENITIKISRKEDDKRSDTSDTQKESIFDDELLQEPHSSEEQLPPSQGPSQRYLSQRSNFASVVGRTQSGNVTTRPANTYFELVLNKAGVDLNEGDTFVLSCDHVVFVNRFREQFKNSQNYPDNIDKFIKELKYALDPNSKLALKLLSGCTISAAGEENVYQSQESMIVNFLMIDFLCERVLEVLLDKIEITATESTTVSKQSTVPLLPLMLAQLRYVVSSHGNMIYERIQKIFDNANYSGKRDVIANSELVLDASKHDEFTKMLLDNVETSSDLFNPTTITALTNLSLSAEMQVKLRYRILAYVQSNECPNDLLPLLVKFMLKILSEDKEVYIVELVESLRKILLHQTCETIENEIQLEIFNYIEQGLIVSRKLFSIWQKIIVSLPERQFGSIDFLVLLMLIHIKEENSLYVENILRRRIKNENLSLDVLNAAKTKFPAILEKYTKILLYVLHDFLKEKHLAVANFARASYEILFQICESVQKSILKKLLQLTCDKSTQNMTNIALELLKNLHRKHPKEIQNWGTLLMPLLDRLNEMTLSQTRLEMELLCSIAYPPPTLSECTALQDQIDMLVKKQLINRNSNVKKQGILGCAQLIDCIARIEDTCAESEDQSSSFNTISLIPDGRGKVAAQLFERVKSATMYCPESLALFYDELASVFISSMYDHPRRGYLNKPFMLWICDVVGTDFMDNFLSDENCTSISNVPTSKLKCINKLEDVAPENSPEEVLSVSVNISNAVLQPSHEAPASIELLAPTFNLLRVLHLQRSEGSLTNINNMLGCAIVLPTFFDDDDFPEHLQTDFDNEVQKKILDIYFYCANWIREIVSSFVTQTDTGNRERVLQRLHDLIKIECRIRKLLAWGPADYMPPKCQFITDTSPLPNKTARGRPAQSKNQTKSKAQKNMPETEMTILNETEDNITTRFDKSVRTVGVTKSKAEKPNFENMYGPKEIYRQMKVNIMLLLSEELIIKMPFPEDKIGHNIGLPEYYFLLTDLVQKLESILGVQKLHIEDNFQYIARPFLFIKQLSEYLTAVHNNLKKIANAINVKLTKVQHMFGNLDLFNEDFCYLRACFNLSVRLLAAYFSWPEFFKDSRTKFLQTSLTNLYATSTSPNNHEVNFDVLITKLFNEFLKYESSILDLKTAVNLHNLLTTFRKLAALNDVSNDVIVKQDNEIRALCKVFLQRKWHNYNGHQERGGRCNICLDVLVKGFLKNCDFQRQHGILTIVHQEAKALKGKDGFMKSFPNLNKINFAILYRGLFEALIKQVHEVISMQSNAYSNDKLKPWLKSCELLAELLEIARVVDMPRNFQVFVKYAHIYIKLVLQYGLQNMEEAVRQNAERVTTFLKTLQTSTRFLHKICCQSKSQKNTVIVSQIPFIRETMEAFLFRVKAMLVANKCAALWDLGTLKNKDTHGNLLQSQSIASESAAEDSEEEMPEDDATVCESLIEPNDQTITNIYANVRDQNGTTATKTSSRSNCF